MAVVVLTPPIRENLRFAHNVYEDENLGQSACTEIKGRNYGVDSGLDLCHLKIYAPSGVQGFYEQPDQLERKARKREIVADHFIIGKYQGHGNWSILFKDSPKIRGNAGNQGKYNADEPKVLGITTVFSGDTSSHSNAPTRTLNISRDLKVSPMLTIDTSSAQDACNLTGYTPNYQYTWESTDNEGALSVLTATDTTYEHATYTLTESAAGNQIHGIVGHGTGRSDCETLKNIGNTFFFDK
jgi:hypothetical protein